MENQKYVRILAECFLEEQLREDFERAVDERDGA
jgi:hypothetical protein